MASRNKKSSAGLTPLKAVAIGVLSVALLVVIVMQFGDKNKRVARQPRGSRTRSTQETSSTPAEQTSSVSTPTRAAGSWPEFNISNVVASNPFKLPAMLAPKVEAATTLTATQEAAVAELNVAAAEEAEDHELRLRQAEFMASLRSKGVDMILRSPRGSVARIGDLSLRVGDVHEGLRVAEISDGGVVFAPSPQGDAPEE